MKSKFLSFILAVCQLESKDSLQDSETTPF